MPLAMAPGSSKVTQANRRKDIPMSSTTADWFPLSERPGLRWRLGARRRAASCGGRSEELLVTNLLRLAGEKSLRELPGCSKVELNRGEMAEWFKAHAW